MRVAAGDSCMKQTNNKMTSITYGVIYPTSEHWGEQEQQICNMPHVLIYLFVHQIHA